jgi:hypothetical protein
MYSNAHESSAAMSGTGLAVAVAAPELYIVPAGISVLAFVITLRKASPACEAK